MKKITFRSPLMALLAFVTVIGMSGLVYAHWFGEGASINGNVQTSGLGAMWLHGWTNDDGDPNFVDRTDDGGPSADGFGVFDHWGPGSSADPSADGRYEKDVGACYAYPEHDGEFLQVDLNNVYPSYHCTFSGLMGAWHDNIPAKTMGMVAFEDDFFRDWVYEDTGESVHFPICFDEAVGDYAETDPDWTDDSQCEEFRYNPARDPLVDPVYFDVELDGRTLIVSADGEPVLTIWGNNICGNQVDPAFWFDNPDNINEGLFSATVHVEQGAEQYSNYGFSISPILTNWNEYDPDMCQVRLLPTRPDGE